jgi:hypothetical protein
MEECVYVCVHILVFLTSALVSGELLASGPDQFTPEERGPGARWIGGWKSPRTSVYDMEGRKFITLLGLELQPPLYNPSSSLFVYLSTK